MTWRGQPRQDGFSVYVGGRVGPDPVFGRVVTTADGKKMKLPAAEAHLAIEQLARTYLAERTGPHETFSNFITRHNPATVAEWLTTPAMRSALAADTAAG
jgi:sulfite reductase beta subunit-like hemoprotein